jgi:hypothetical protein
MLALAGQLFRFRSKPVVAQFEIRGRPSRADSCDYDEAWNGSQNGFRSVCEVQFVLTMRRVTDGRVNFHSDPKKFIMDKRACMWSGLELD